MNKSENLRHNPDHCAELAEDVKGQPSVIDAFGFALASEQDWLSGRAPPARVPDPDFRQNHG
jgi:hypothetical protein